MNVYLVDTGEQIDHVSYTYNQKGQLTKAVHTNYDTDDEEAVVTEYRYTYDEKGKVASYSKETEGDEGYISEKFTHTYNEKGELTATKWEEVYYEDGRESYTAMTSEMSYHYGDFGLKRVFFQEDLFGSANVYSFFLEDDPNVYVYNTPIHPYFGPESMEATICTEYAVIADYDPIIVRADANDDEAFALLNVCVGPKMLVCKNGAFPEITLYEPLEACGVEKDRNGRLTAIESKGTCVEITYA